MAKHPDLSREEVTMVINALGTQKAVFERAKRAGDPEIAAVYEKKLAALASVSLKFEGSLL